jgi:hypothetical protein
MNITKMNTIFNNKNSSTVLSFLVLISMLFIGIGSVFAANPQFNYMSNDIKTLRIGNYTTSAGTLNWSSSITAVAGNRIAVDVYYHNGVTGTTATNTRMKISFPTTANTQMVLTGTLSADNAVIITDTATLNIANYQFITPETQAKWLPNQQTTGGTMINVSNTGNSIEVNIGNVAGGWPTQGHVIFYFNISNFSQNPTVNAGPDVTLYEGQLISFSGTANDPQNDPLIFSWTCTGGSLTNSTTLNPTYKAPLVNADTTYVCTLTTTDNKGNSASDSLNVKVLQENLTVNAGPDVSVKTGQSIVLSGTATDPLNHSLTYAWACTKGNLTNSTTLNPTYKAPSVSLTTTYICTLTARDSFGNTGSDTMNVTVLYSCRGK